MTNHRYQSIFYVVLCMSLVGCDATSIHRLQVENTTAQETDFVTIEIDGNTYKFGYIGSGKSAGRHLDQNIHVNGNSKVTFNLPNSSQELKLTFPQTTTNKKKELHIRIADAEISCEVKAED